jgi:hypothetical protein
MGILDKIKYGLDVPRWQQMSPITTHAAGGSLCADKRNDASAWQAIFQYASATVLNAFYGPPNGMAFIGSPGVSAFGAGSCAIFCPSQGIRSTCNAGSSTTMVKVKASITTVPLNGLCITDQIGMRIRVIFNVAGSHGLVEERTIIGNTAGTQPDIYVSPAFTNAPHDGDTFEILSGRVFMLGTTAGATQFRYYDIATNTFASAGNTTALIATDSSMQCLDELYVPYDRKPGEGFLIGASTYDTGGTTKGCLLGTGSAGTTLTGQAAAGDAGVLQNEYRNFQIRIVEDTAIPTAVGQRITIKSHTAGPSPIYTIGAASWPVATPTATCKFVIENPNVILLFTVVGGTAVYTYNPTPATINNGTATITAGAFSTTYFGARGTVVAAGTFSLPSWSHQPTTNADGTRNTRHSYVYSFRGGATTALDVLDIAGGAAGTWTNGMAYMSQGTSFTTGTCGKISPHDQLGRWGYIILGATGLVFRFDIKHQSIYPWATLPLQSGTAAAGERIEVLPYMTSAEADKMGLVFAQSHLGTALWRSEVIF